MPLREEEYEFQVSAEEMAFLKEVASNDQTVARLIERQKRSHGNTFSIQMARSESEQLRELLTVQLAKVGFKDDYSLTKQGGMLEDLIDRFYLP